MKNIAIIPARSGSKGLPNKNIKLFEGKPLLAHSIDAAIHSNMFDEIMVSTDSSEYAEIALRYGANVPFLRSSETSTDHAGSWDVVIEVLKKYKQLQNREFDTICLLQPTSPLRRAGDIIGGYNAMKDHCALTITGVCEVDHSPLWTMTLPEDCSMAEFRANNQNRNTPRQLLEKYYRINGALYIKTISYLNGVELLEGQEYAFIMPRENSIDIDTLLDFSIAEIFSQYFLRQ